MSPDRQQFQMLEKGLSSIEDGIIHLASQFGQTIPKQPIPHFSLLSPEHQRYQMVSFGLNSIAKALNSMEVGYMPIADRDYLSIASTKSLIAENMPKKGKDYFTPEEVQSFIAKIQSSIRTPKDGKDAVIDYDKILNFVRKEVSQIPIPKDGQPGKNAEVDYDKVITDVLAKIILPQPEEVDYDKIYEFIKKELKKLPKGGIVRQFFNNVGGSSTSSGSGTVGPGTINQIAYFDTATTVASLSTSIYPSLTELAYVKGVTSAIQTQLDAKVSGSGTSPYYPYWSSSTGLDTGQIKNENSGRDNIITGGSNGVILSSDFSGSFNSTVGTGNNATVFSTLGNVIFMIYAGQVTKDTKLVFKQNTAGSGNSIITTDGAQALKIGTNGTTAITIDSSQNVVLTNPLGAGYGGTGIAGGYSNGDMIYYNTISSAFTRLAAGTNGDVLSNTFGVPQWVSRSSLGFATTALDNLASVAINAALVLATNDAFALGSTSKMWSDLFLANGAVINFNNGNVTITHTSSGLLTVNSDVQFGTSSSGLLVDVAWFSGNGVWIDMSTAGPSGIGTGGAGSNPWIAYAFSAGNWFSDTGAGDVAYRNASGKNILIGIGSSASMMKVSGSTVQIGTGSSGNGITITPAWLSNGVWIDLSTGGSSGIGTGGPGANPFLAYVSSAGHWFTGSAVGDVAYRSASGTNILIGVGSGSPALKISGSSVLSNLNIDLSTHNLVTDTSTGTKLGTATSQKLGFWNATPIVQPTTAITAATFVANTSGIANDTATFDGYTIGQVVKALRNAGLLA